MSKRGHVHRQLKMLDELGGILGAMKNLSLMETVKLTRLVAYQHRVLESIAAVASDFLCHHPESMRAVAPAESRIAIAVGSQRGFCGEFNESIVRALEGYQHDSGGGLVKVIVVGRRLAAKLAKRPGIVATLDGASVAEEAHSVLQRVMDALTEVHAGAEGAPISEVVVLAHRDGSVGVSPRALWPPKTGALRPASHAPLLNLALSEFRRQLVWHFLWAQMHDVFYGSLMAENRRRLQHMQGATQRMDERRDTLRRKFNVLRQEEITEEIEVILLSDSAIEGVKSKVTSGKLQTTDRIE